MLAVTLVHLESMVRAKVVPMGRLNAKNVTQVIIVQGQAIMSHALVVSTATCQAKARRPRLAHLSVPWVSLGLRRAKRRMLRRALITAAQADT